VICHKDGVWAFLLFWCGGVMRLSRAKGISWT
jgi:hypothetical protein